MSTQSESVSLANDILATQKAITNLATAIGADIKSVRERLNTLESTLTTLNNALNDLNQRVSELEP